MSKSKWILWVLMILMIIPSVLSAHNCLFLSSISDPGAVASEPMIFWLQDEGHEITIVGSRDFWTWTLADVTAFDFMFVCEVVDSATLYNDLFTADSLMSFEGHPIPVVTTENYAARGNTFAYTSSTSTNNYPAEKIEIVNGDHPLAAGYETGKKVTVHQGSGTPDDLIPNSPEIDFIPIAKGTQDIPGYVIYGVEKGVLTVNGVETVNRGAVCGYHANGYAGLTDEAYEFLNAAVAWVMEGASPVEETRTASSKNYALNQNYPNPFNPTTQISFNLEKAGQTVLTVYNALGQEVTTLIDANLTSGYHQITFNSNQYNLESGVYYYEIKCGSFSQVNKMLLMK